MSKPLLDAENTTPNRRRIWLINPRFQLSFLLYTVGSAVVSSFIFYGANMYFFWRFNRLGHTLGLPADHVFFRFIADQRSAMTYVLIAFSLLAIGVLAVVGLLMSHRVAGPLYRMKQHLLGVAESGEDKPVRFREKDYFQEVSEAYNLRFRQGQGQKKVTRGRVA